MTAKRDKHSDLLRSNITLTEGPSKHRSKVMIRRTDGREDLILIILKEGQSDFVAGDEAKFVLLRAGKAKRGAALIAEMYPNYSEAECIIPQFDNSQATQDEAVEFIESMDDIIQLRGYSDATGALIFREAMLEEPERWHTAQRKRHPTTMRSWSHAKVAFIHRYCKQLTKKERAVLFGGLYQREGESYQGFFSRCDLASRIMDRHLPMELKHGKLREEYETQTEKTAIEYFFKGCNGDIITALHEQRAMEKKKTADKKARQSKARQEGQEEELEADEETTSEEEARDGDQVRMTIAVAPGGGDGHQERATRIPRARHGNKASKYFDRRGTRKCTRGPAPVCTCPPEMERPERLQHSGLFRPPPPHQRGGEQDDGAH